MKKTLTILILFACVTIQAQVVHRSTTIMLETQDALRIEYIEKPLVEQTWWERNRLPIGVLSVQVLNIGLNSVGDGLFDEGKATGNLSQMRWGHTLRASSAGVLVVGIPLLTKWGLNWKHTPAFTVEWLLLRYGLFDLGYNTTRGLNPLYAGTTATIDNTVSTMPPAGRAITKAWSVGVAIGINWYEIGGRKHKKY